MSKTNRFCPRDAVEAGLPDTTVEPDPVADAVCDIRFDARLAREAKMSDIAKHHRMSALAKKFNQEHNHNGKV